MVSSEYRLSSTKEGFAKEYNKLRKAALSENIYRFHNKQEDLLDLTTALLKI